MSEMDANWIELNMTMYTFNKFKCTHLKLETLAVFRKFELVVDCVEKAMNEMPPDLQHTK